MVTVKAAFFWGTGLMALSRTVKKCLKIIDSSILRLITKIIIRLIKKINKID